MDAPHARKGGDLTGQQSDPPIINQRVMGDGLPSRKRLAATFTADVLSLSERVVKIKSQELPS